MCLPVQGKFNASSETWRMSNEGGIKFPWHKLEYILTQMFFPTHQLRQRICQVPPLPISVRFTTSFFLEKMFFAKFLRNIVELTLVCADCPCVGGDYCRNSVPYCNSRLIKKLQGVEVIRTNKVTD